jgi:ceramide glucosyltransferase
VQAKLIFTGEPPYPHDKVYKLQQLLEASRNDLIVMSDSDVRVTSDFCSAIASEFAERPVDLVTCPYKAIGGPALASRLEALSMNVDFSTGLFTASLLEGTKFAVGPTIVARRSALEELGGLEAFKDYLAEDFMLGNVASRRGFRVALSPYIIEHRIGSEIFAKNIAHRFRWARTTRRSRPAGYLGQFFTYPASAALCLSFTGKYWLWLLLVTTALRVAKAWTVSQWCLRAPVNWFLLPLSDLLTFLFWIGGFFGNTISWRGKTFHLNRDGTVRASP